MDIHDEIYQHRKGVGAYWYNKASDLRGSAGALWACMDDVRSSEVVAGLGLGAGFSMKVATFPVYLMLCGMSLELLYKAIVVSSGNEPNTSSHKLTELASKAGLKVSKEEAGLLEVLSESVIWQGRYPIPKQPVHLKQFNELVHEHLYEKKPLGKLNVLTPKGSLGWDSFNQLWSVAYEQYSRQQ